MRHWRMHVSAVVFLMLQSVGAAAAQSPFICDDAHSCWTLTLRLASTSQATPEVFFENSLNPLPSVVKGTSIEVRLPVFAPGGRAYYRFTVSIPRAGDDPLDMHFLAPAFVNTRPLEIPVDVSATPLSAQGISDIITGTTRKSGASFWRAYFQGLIYLGEAQDERNSFLVSRAQLAIFQGCAGLARDARFRLIFSFNEEHDHCIGDGVSAGPADLADVSVDRWLLFSYAAVNLPDAKPNSDERLALRDLLVWLRGLWPTEQALFSTYSTVHRGDKPPNRPPFPSSLQEFDHLTEDVAAPSKSESKAGQ